MAKEKSADPMAAGSSTALQSPTEEVKFPTTVIPTPKVFQAICNVMQAISEEGISKDRKNTSQNYNFRGIDDVYNALCSLLSKNKLCMLPYLQDIHTDERVTAKGTVMFSVKATFDFNLVSAEDGSQTTIRTIGEAMDTGDKATNKAQSTAYKYAALMAFCIPTEGSGKDSEEDTPTDIAPRQQKAAPAAKKADAAPATPPAEIKAPHDPNTGEMLPPHAIAVPVVNGTGDPEQWARVYIAALKSDPDNIEQWVKFNATLMGQLASYSPAAHKAVTKTLNDIRAAKAPENPIAAG